MPYIKHYTKGNLLLKTLRAQIIKAKKGWKTIKDEETDFWVPERAQESRKGRDSQEIEIIVSSKWSKMQWYPILFDLQSVLFL